MIRPSRARTRKGYSLTVVLIFLILLFALWSTVYRSTSSLLRIETNRVMQQTRDQGTMNALGQALQLLTYSKPFDSSNPSRTLFVYGVTVTVQGASGSCTSTDYTVQYSPAPQKGTNCWQVQVSPGTSSPPLPNAGTTVQW